MNKRIARFRRAKKTRQHLYRLGTIRLVVHRTSRHIYAQIISKDSSEVLVASSTIECILRNQLKNTGNKKSAERVGELVAQRAVAKGIVNVSFDRSGFKYHGRIKTLADAARSAGLVF